MIKWLWLRCNVEMILRFSFFQMPRGSICSEMVTNCGISIKILIKSIKFWLKLLNSIKIRSDFSILDLKSHSSIPLFNFCISRFVFFFLSLRNNGEFSSRGEEVGGSDPWGTEERRKQEVLRMWQEGFDFLPYCPYLTPMTFSTSQLLSLISRVPPMSTCSTTPSCVILVLDCCMAFLLLLFLLLLSSFADDFSLSCL